MLQELRLLAHPHEFLKAIPHVANILPLINNDSTAVVSIQRSPMSYAEVCFFERFPLEIVHHACVHTVTTQKDLPQRNQWRCDLKTGRNFPFAVAT